LGSVLYLRYYLSDSGVFKARTSGVSGEVVVGRRNIYLFWNLRVREMMVSVPIATPPLRLPAPIQSAVICG